MKGLIRLKKNILDIDNHYLRHIELRVKIEKYWPITVAAVVTVIFMYFNTKLEDTNSVISDTIDNSLSISGTLIGFFLTIFTILSTVKTRRMKFIKEAGLYPRVNQYLVAAIIWHLINISLILFLPIIESLKLPCVYRIIWQTGMIFVIIFSWTLSIRFTSIFLQLLKEK